MQLTSTTDYAIRMVVYLAMEGRKISSVEISEKMGIPLGYLRIISSPLRAAGMIASHKGSQGGYSLAVAPSEITLFDIINLTEGTTKINRCLEHDRYCSRFATETCPVRRCYLYTQAVIERALGAVTISQLIGQESDKSSKPIEAA